MNVLRKSVPSLMASETVLHPEAAGALGSASFPSGPVDAVQRSVHGQRDLEFSPLRNEPGPALAAVHWVGQVQTEFTVEKERHEIF